MGKSNKGKKNKPEASSENLRPKTSSEDLLDGVITGDAQFVDSFQTREQKARDCEITKLLRQYVSAYTQKIETQKKYRSTLLILFSIIISSFSLAFLVLLLYFGFNSKSVDTSGVVSLISICVTFLASILGLAQIIVKYCFPEKDEEYITKIVETIQKNDYDNKLANMNSATTTRDLMGGTVGSSSGEVMSARDDDTRDSSATNQASPTANDSSDSDNTN